MRSMLQMRSICFYILCALCSLPPLAYGQGFSLPLGDQKNKEWRRITTGQDSTTDIGVSTLVLEPNGIFRATFKIELSKSEEAAEKPGAKYKVRHLTIQFDSRKSAYRIFETTLFDGSEKMVFTSGPNPSATWRPLVRTSQAYSSYYSAARELSPLGMWRIASSSDQQSTATTGRMVTIALDRFQVLGTCTAPDYESTSMTRQQVAEVTGLSSTVPPDVDLSPDKVSVVKIKCPSSTGVSEIHILIPKAIDRAVLVSGGTLYALEK